MSGDISSYLGRSEKMLASQCDFLRSHFFFYEEHYLRGKLTALGKFKKEQVSNHFLGL